MKTETEIEVEIACEEAKIPMLQKQLSEFLSKEDFGGTVQITQAIDLIKTKINTLKWVIGQ
jgi:hypothetical protein